MNEIKDFVSTNKIVRVREFFKDGEVFKKYFLLDDGRTFYKTSDEVVFEKFILAEVGDMIQVKFSDMRFYYDVVHFEGTIDPEE